MWHFFSKRIWSSFKFSQQGQYYHWSRKSCDVSFQNDMYHLCTLPHNKSFVFEILKGVKKVLKTKEEAHCHTIAYLYYKAVDLLGGDRYDYISPEWCRDRCVEKIGSPNRRIGYSKNIWFMFKRHCEMIPMHFYTLGVFLPYLNNSSSRALLANK